MIQNQQTKNEKCGRKHEDKQSDVTLNIRGDRNIPAQHNIMWFYQQSSYNSSSLFSGKKSDRHRYLA